jgi:carbamate kinase
MAPKLEAACRFARRCGRPAHLGALEEVEAILAGQAGTTLIRVDSA